MTKNVASSKNTTTSDTLRHSAESALLPETLTDGRNADEFHEEPRRMRPLRFAVGLILTTFGMSTVLLIGVRFLEVQQLGGDFALAIVAIGILTGVTLLGGGFGLMASASSGFDEREFHSLMHAGNISSASMPLETPSEIESKVA